jgi:hypothetical protein
MNSKSGALLCVELLTAFAGVVKLANSSINSFRKCFEKRKNTRMVSSKTCRHKSCGFLVAAAALLIFASIPSFGSDGVGLAHAKSVADADRDAYA